MAELATTALFSDANLQGYWKLGDVNDSSPNAYHLTNNGVATFEAGKYDNAVKLVAASSQYLSRAQASIANLRIAGSQSWVCWVNQTTISSYQKAMSMSNGDGSISTGILTSADSGNVVYFDMPGLTTNTQVNSGAIGLTTGAWYHLAGVYNSETTTLKIYVNAVEGGSVTASGSKTDITSGGFAIGARGDAGAFLNGLVDDAAIFNRALTVAEIESLYASPRGFIFIQS